jgi:GxxExxY protein
VEENQLIGVIQVSQESTLRQKADELSREIIGAAIEVHKRLGPGLLESAYEECLCCELSLRGIEFKRQLPLPVIYKGQKLDCGYRLDMLVEDLVIIEVKAIEEICPIHEAQLLTYLRLRNSWLGLIINFNVLLLKDGIRRLVNG